MRHGWRGLYGPRLVLALLLLACAPAYAAKTPPQPLTAEESAQLLQKAADDYAANKWDRGIVRLEEALARVREPAPVLLLLAEGYLGLGEPHEAVAVLGESLDVDPACLKCAAKLGYVLVGLEERDRAVTVLEAALARHPDDPVLTRHLALARSGDGVKLKVRLSPETQARADRAKQELEEQIRRFGQSAGPVPPATGGKTGEAWLLEKNFEKAVTVLEAELETWPDDAERWTNLGVARDSLGHHAASAKAHQKALEISPSFAIAWNNLGHAREMQEKWDDALSAYQRALSLSPSYGLALQNLANTYLKTERVSEALGANLAAAALDPADPAPHNNMAFAWFKLGYCAKALDHLKKAKGLDPSQPTVQENMDFIRDAMKGKEGLCQPPDARAEAQIATQASAAFSAAQKGQKTAVAPPVASARPMPSLPAAPGTEPPPLPGFGQSWPVGGTVPGRLLLGLATGEVLNLKGAGVLSREPAGLFHTARGGVRAWVAQNRRQYTLMVQREGKPARALFTTKGFLMNLTLSPDGLRLAYTAFSPGDWQAVTKVVDIARGKELLKHPGKPQSLAWQDNQTLLVLARRCASGGVTDLCLKRLPLKGRAEVVDFGPSAKNLFYAEGSALSQVVKGVLYAPSPLLTDTLVRLDLNTREVRLIQPPPLAKNTTPVRAVAIREGVAALALAVGREVWLITEKETRPTRFATPARVVSLDWWPY